MVDQKGYRTPESCKVVQVIHVVDTRGSGSGNDPVRTVNQYWSLDGVLLAEDDKTPPIPRVKK